MSKLSEQLQEAYQPHVEVLSIEQDTIDAIRDLEQRLEAAEAALRRVGDSTQLVPKSVINKKVRAARIEELEYVLRTYNRELSWVRSIIEERIKELKEGK